jgi:hypothetical protein
MEVRNRKGRMFVMKRTDVRNDIVYSLLFSSIVFYKNNHKTTNNYTSFRNIRLLHKFCTVFCVLGKFEALQLVIGKR